MLDHLDDPTPPQFDDRVRQRVIDRCASQQKRRRVVVSTALIVPALVVVGAVVGRSTLNQDRIILTSQDSQPDIVAAVPDSVAPDPTLVPRSTVAPATTTPTSAPATVGLPGDPDVILLGDRDISLTDDEWLWPTVLPPGYEFREGTVWYAPDSVDPEQESTLDVSRRYTFADAPLVEGSGRQLIIEIDLSIFKYGIGEGTNRTVQINGTDWEFSDPDTAGNGAVPPHVRSATRWVGETVVTLFPGPDMTDAQLIEAVKTLAVIDRSEIEGPVVDPMSPNRVHVATGNLDDFELTLDVETFDDATCYYVEVGDRLGVDEVRECEPNLPIDGVMTGTHLHEAHHPQNSTVLEILAYGSVRNDVVRLDVVTFDGTVTSLTPDTGAQGDVQKYWFLAGVFDIDPEFIEPNAPLFLPPTIVSITAYDADGNVLAVDVTEDWRTTSTSD